MTGLQARSFPAEEVCGRARAGMSAAFPPAGQYGRAVFGASERRPDPFDELRLCPPIFTPQRMDKLIDLGREPVYSDVDLACDVGGFAVPLPVYVSAFGSTQLLTDLALPVSRQAAQLGLPMVIGENVLPVNGAGRLDTAAQGSLLARIRAYSDEVADDQGGLVVQQSTEDADAEVWNLVYSDPSAQRLLERGRLGFELKVGQGAKPGIGGMTVLSGGQTDRLAESFALDAVFGDDRRLRSSSPGTLSQEILHHQIRQMRNNFPRARVWVKLHPGRDVAEAAQVAWQAGADSVTIDGAEGGSGWAPVGFFDQVGLPLAECLRRIGRTGQCLLVSGRMWEGVRAVKSFALGARAVGLGRAALLAVDEDREQGLVNLVSCLALELRLLISALAKYDVGSVDLADLWCERAGWLAEQPVSVGSAR